MKLIVTGATGYIGAEVLRQCLCHPDVTTVVALTRRPLPSSPNADDPRVRNIVMRDFAEYPEEILRELEGAQGCIW